MKRVKNGRRVLSGKIDASSYSGIENRIQLFDGKFTTGYRIVDFKISSTYPLNAGEWVAKLSTEPKSGVATWQWDDVQQLAWARSGTQADYASTYRTVIREDNMVIEDLWISAYSTTESNKMNYEITLEKYTFASWDGAGILVENLSQAGPE